MPAELLPIHSTKVLCPRSARAELEQAVAGGWQLGTFGPRILRVETAAMLAAALFAVAWER